MRSAPALHSVRQECTQGNIAKPTSPGFLRKGDAMFNYAVTFLVIALVAGLFGFTGIAAGAVEIAKILFFIFIVLFVASLVLGLMRRK